MSHPEDHDDSPFSRAPGDDALTEGVEPESTEPGFLPLDKDRLEDDDDDMTFEEPPRIIAENEEHTLPHLLREEEAAIARSPSPGDTLEEPPPRFLTSDPPPGPPESPSQGHGGGETQPMSPVPPQSKDDGEAPAAIKARNPVMVPSPDRLFTPSPSSDSSWSEGDPMRPSDFPDKDRLGTGLAAESPSQATPSRPAIPAAPQATGSTPSPQQTRKKGIPVALLATTMFVLGFVATGAFIWWFSTDRDSDDEAAVVHDPPDPTGDGGQQAIAEPTIPPNASGVPASAQPPEPTPNPTNDTVPQLSPADARARSETLLDLGDEEVQRIQPSTEVRSVEDFDQALAVPRAHYDTAQEQYEQAIRFNPDNFQCIHVRMAMAAEQLATAYERTADSPQVQTIDSVRFPQELRDTAANYRSVSRRHYQTALRAPSVDNECASLASSGFRRTSAALGLPARP